MALSIFFIIFGVIPCIIYLFRNIKHKCKYCYAHYKGYQIQ
ncbi:hypothetical protein [Xylanivirga thermophila]